MACTVEVPASLTAKRVNRADGLAAHQVVAVGALVRVAATAGAWVSAGDAEALRPIHASLVPSQIATAWVDGAHSLATFGITAVGIFVHNDARAGRGQAAVGGQCDGAANACFVPPHVAARFVSGRCADKFADRAIVAGRRCVGFKARVLHKPTVGAVLLGERDADIIPCDVATCGLSSTDK